jgi:DegV family protein with EDD domain
MMTTYTKIKFVTDSVADIPVDLVTKWDIAVVPAFVNFGGKSYADDGVELKREDYYNQLVEMSEAPTTSAMSPEVARKIIESAFEGADHLIIITTPDRLSGIHNAMRLGAADLPEDKVTLVDSGTLSMGIAWQVLIGADIALKTGDVQKTVSAIKGVQSHTRVHAALATIEYLRRSGRVGWAAASIGSLLNIKPVVEVINGEAKAIARVRTFGRALDKLAELAKNYTPIDKLAIMHVNNPQAAEELKNLLGEIVPPDVFTGIIGPTLGTHIGPGTVGFASVSKGWNNAISA